jgi:hypothetical protein
MTEGDNSLEKVISAVGKEPASAVKSGAGFFRDLVKQSQAAENLADKENREILGMRQLWSRWILIFIGVIVMFDVILVYFYGTGAWDFKDSKVVMVVITENFLKIIGLGILITQSLFKKIF